MAMSIAEKTQFEALVRRVEALEAELKRRRGGRPKKQAPEMMTPAQVNASLEAARKVA